MSSKTVDLRLTGGASNTDPSLSLGGVVSSQNLYGMTLAWDTTPLNGVTLVDGAGEYLSGDLQLVSTDDTLTWTATGDITATASDKVDVSAGGVFTIESPTFQSSITIDVDAVTIIAEANDIKTVNFTQILNSLFPNVTAQQALTGVVQYRCLYLVGLSGTVSCKFFIEKQLNGLDYFSYGFSGSASDVIDEPVLSDEFTAPLGVSFTTITNQTDADVLTINQGEHIAVYIKRTVPPLTDVATVNDVARFVLVES